jgi:MFS family permease
VTAGVLALAGVTAALTQTLVVPLLTDLPRLLHTDPGNASWLVTITLLTAAVTTPVAGRLGDLHGKRRVILVLLAPLVAGSFLCAVADSLTPMLIGRGLQGMSMAVISLGISALRDVMPPRELSSAIALIGSSLGIGGALGLPLSAAIAQTTSWRVLFWGAGALGLLVAILVRRFLPDTPARSPGRFDLVGALGLSTGLTLLLVVLSKGAAWGWTEPTILTLLAFAVVVLVGWGWWELRVPHPLVDVRLARRTPVLLTHASSLVIGCAMYGQTLIVPQLLQLPTSTGYGLGQSMLAMGLWMAPSGLVMMAVAPLGARLSDARGPKTTLAAGSLVLALGYGISLMWLSSPWGLLIATSIGGAGTGLAYGALPALIIGLVPNTATGSANSLNTLMRSIGSSVSAAVVGAVLAGAVSAESRGLPLESGFRHTLMITGAAALVSAVVALCIPVARRSRSGSVSRGAVSGVDA